MLPGRGRTLRRIRYSRCGGGGGGFLGASRCSLGGGGGEASPDETRAAAGASSAPRDARAASAAGCAGSLSASPGRGSGDSPEAEAAGARILRSGVRGFSRGGAGAACAESRDRGSRVLGGRRRGARILAIGRGGSRRLAGFGRCRRAPVGRARRPRIVVARGNRGPCGLVVSRRRDRGAGTVPSPGRGRSLRFPRAGSSGAAREPAGGSASTAGAHKGCRSDRRWGPSAREKTGRLRRCGSRSRPPPAGVDGDGGRAPEAGAAKPGPGRTFRSRHSGSPRSS
jgi:hypothetical protein